ncbi:hypothetical protein CALVIDRAFT_565132 [Calocera viscosa TUFC12733]|uniref:Uncharacterized protein n=1 Tax=Calocera viscosa (strain TUFC12733) TaxID=1330018 RepID=A0A167KUJ5_CALVF|nr:hypothetical protein CALVIDRAFT_565132 [Calocera viscosa TUFC12733]
MSPDQSTAPTMSTDMLCQSGLDQRDNWPSLPSDGAQNEELQYQQEGTGGLSLTFANAGENLTFSGPIMGSHSMYHEPYMSGYSEQPLYPMHQEPFPTFDPATAPQYQPDHFTFGRPTPPRLALPGSIPPGPASAPPQLPSNSDCHYHPTQLSHQLTSSGLPSAAARSSVMRAIEDPRSYSLENGLPPIPRTGQLASQPPPSTTTTVTARSTNPNPSSAPSPLDPRLRPAAHLQSMRTKAMEPLGLSGWTPAKLYQTPIRRMHSAPGVPPPGQGWKSKSVSPPSTGTRDSRDSTPRGGMGRSPRDTSRPAEDYESDGPNTRAVRGRKRRATRSDVGNARPTKKRSGDPVYVRALEENLEQLKQQILHLGSQPYGLEGVNDASAMTLDSAKLVIQAQQLDLDAVRRDYANSQREISQLRAAMNGTHALLAAPPTAPPAAGPRQVFRVTSTFGALSAAEIEAARRASVESIASTSSMASACSISSVDSMGSMTSAATASTVPSPSAPVFNQPSLTQNSAAVQHWAAWEQQQQGLTACQGQQ